MMSLQGDISDKQPSSGQTSSVITERRELTKCSYCYVKFSRRNSMYKHIRTFHPGEKLDIPIKTKNLCLLCDEDCFTIRNLHKHLSEKHEIELCHEKKTFYCEYDFYQWKEQIEKDTPCQFIVHRSKAELSDGRTAVHFMCSRSGVFKPSGNGKRKSAGTQKIGKMCPAYISMYKSVLYEAEEIEIDFQSVHVGHEVDIRKIRLTPAEKSQLAGAMYSGIPKSTILSKLQEGFSPNKRICYINRKDLHNIAHSFRIKDTVSLSEVEDDSRFRKLEVQNVKMQKYNPVQNTVTNASLENDKNALKIELEEIFNQCKSVEHLKILRQSIQQVKAQYKVLELDSFSFPRLEENMSKNPIKKHIIPQHRYLKKSAKPLKKDSF